MSYLTMSDCVNMHMLRFITFCNQTCSTSHCLMSSINHSFSGSQNLQAQWEEMNKPHRLGHIMFK